MDQRMSLAEILDELDGYGLVITDYELIDECLDKLGIDKDILVDTFDYEEDELE